MACPTLQSRARIHLFKLPNVVHAQMQTFEFNPFNNCNMIFILHGFYWKILHRPKISKNYIIGILYKTLQSLKLDNIFEIYFIVNYYIKYTKDFLHVLDVEQDDSFN